MDSGLKQALVRDPVSDPRTHTLVQDNGFDGRSPAHSSSSSSSSSSSTTTTTTTKQQQQHHHHHHHHHQAAAVTTAAAAAHVLSGMHQCVCVRLAPNPRPARAQQAGRQVGVGAGVRAEAFAPLSQHALQVGQGEVA